jgi:hypothetical protein
MNKARNDYDARVIIASSNHTICASVILILILILIRVFNYYPTSGGQPKMCSFQEQPNAQDTTKSMKTDIAETKLSEHPVVLL